MMKLARRKRAETRHTNADASTLFDPSPNASRTCHTNGALPLPNARGLISTSTLYISISSAVGSLHRIDGLVSARRHVSRPQSKDVFSLLPSLLQHARRTIPDPLVSHPKHLHATSVQRLVHARSQWLCLQKHGTSRFGSDARRLQFCPTRCEMG
jgi:hypothetical protein